MNIYNTQTFTHFTVKQRCHQDHSAQRPRPRKQDSTWAPAGGHKCVH